MDYEKKYKEALEKAHKLCAYPISKPFISDLQDLFPELKESEDERIRKELIAEVKEQIDCIPAKDCRDEEDEKALKQLCKWLAWLEKQGEQKPNPYSGTSFEYNGHTWGMCARDNGVDILRDKHIVGHLEKQGSQNLANSAKTCKVEPKPNPCDGCVNRNGCINCENGELREVEQKPAWSEEDEKGLGDALWCCKQAASIAKDENDMGNVWFAEHWLKSLKQRMKGEEV